MPHIIIDYTVELEEKLKSSQLKTKIHQLMINSKICNPAAIKTRTNKITDYIVGELEKGNFVHVWVSLLDGRDEKVLKKLSADIFQMLKENISEADVLSVDINEMDSRFYSK